MPKLKLILLGPPRIERDGTIVEISRRKAVALLAYLAMVQQSHSRDALSTLFWSTSDQSHARAALRRVLSDLNKALGESWLDTSGENVILRSDSQVWIDVNAFRSILAACESHGHSPGEPCEACIPLLTRAVSLYHDDFLAGFTLPDSPAFDEWQFFQTEGLRRELADVLERLVRYYMGRKDFEAAIPYARRWLALDPLLEAPHYVLMQLYACTDQRVAASRQYQEYARILREELDIKPSQDITRLHDQIRRDEFKPARRKGNGRESSKGLPPVLPGAAADGSPLPFKEEDEIRLVTVLFAGFSSSDRTSWDLHPEEIAASANTLLRTVNEVVSKYGAQTDRFVGDGVQVVFGTPQVHEDDPERAVRAALEIQELGKRQGLSVTVGISTGRVYFSQINMVESQGITAIGPVVTLAARLQDKAQSGQVVVSAATHRYIRRKFKFVPLTLDIGGMDEPMTTYQVVKARPHSGKFWRADHPPTKLIGRDEEVSKLKTALTKALQGQGQVVSLIGEAGLGSSRLIWELKRAAFSTMSHKRQLLWLEGHCLEFRSATSYWPFIDILQTYLRLCSEDEQDHAQCLTTILTKMLEQGDLAPHRFEEIGALLGNLLAVRFGNQWDERLRNTNPEQIRHQTFLAVCDFFQALARRQPVVLVFEELQWADELSLDLFSLLLERVPVSSMLVLCAFRPEWRHRPSRLSTIASQKCPEAYEELWLRELTLQQTRWLVESLLHTDDPPPAVVDLILERARGNPFFVKEAVQALIDTGTIYRVEGRWRVKDEVETVSVPESVQSIILSRIDRLEPDLKHVLRSAAVMGRIFQTDILGQLTPPEIDLKRALTALEEAALIYRERIVPEEAYAFRHVLIQETVYRSNSRRQRSRLHSLVAEIIEQQYSDNLSEYYEQLAYHYNQSEAIEKAIEYLLKSGEKSRRAYLNDEAIHYFRQALKRLDDIDLPPLDETRLLWQLAALKGLGQIYHEQGLAKVKEAEHYLHRAIAIGQKAGVRVSELTRLYYWLGEVMYWQGRYPEQVQIGEAGLALLDDDQAESVEAVLMNQTLAVGHLGQGNRTLFQALTKRTLQFLQCLPYSEELRPAYLHVIRLYMNEDVEKTRDWLEVCEKLFEQHHDLRALAEIYDYRWLCSFQSGDLHGAISFFPRQLSLYTQIGDNSRVWRCLGNMVWSYLILGDLDKADRYADEALEKARSLGLEGLLCESYLNVGLVKLSQVSWPQALDAFEKALEYTSNAARHWLKWIVFYCLGSVNLAVGNRQTALNHFQMAMRLFTPHVSLGWRYKWGSLLRGLLHKLEAACETPEEFLLFWRSFDEVNRWPDMLPLPTKRYLQPVEMTLSRPLSLPLRLNDNFDEPLASEWSWQDPFNDCSFVIQGGLVMLAANGRDLYYPNSSAPRLLRQASGDFIIQTIGGPANHDSSPAMGGLLLWKDSANFLRLVIGYQGKDEICFEGCIDHKVIVAGRGMLRFTIAGDKKPGDHKFVLLRLERSGESVRGLCSMDGKNWFSVGQTIFTAADPVQVGLFALGWLDRTAYPGEHRDGTAIRFKSFQMWGE